MKFIQSLTRTRTHAQLHGMGAICAAVTMLAMIGAAVPAWTRHTERLNMLTALDAADARLQRARVQVELARREIQLLEPKIAAGMAADGASRTLDRRLLDVSSVATDLGLQIDSVEPGAVTKRPNGEIATAIAASGQGSYPRVIAFMHKLRQVAPDLTIETVQLNAGPEQGCAFRLSLNWWSAPASVARPQAVAGGDAR